MLRSFLLFVLVISILAINDSAYASFGDITLTPPKTVSMNGQELDTVNVDEPVGISSILTNHDKKEHKFTYIVQILNKEGGTDYLEGLSASFLPNQSFTASQSWTPSESGKYTVQIFVWESLATAIPLTPVMQTEIIVQ